MNYIDVALIVIIVVIGFRGFASGFVAEFCSLVGVLLGVYLGSVFASPVGNVLKNVYDFGSSTIHTTLGFIIVLLVCWALFVLIGIVLASKLVFLRLDFLNKGLGFIFASVKVFFIFSFIAYAVSQISFIRENFVQSARANSQMYVNMINIAQKIMKLSVVDGTLQNLSDITQGKASADSLEQGLEEVKQTVQNLNTK
ncbi:CvpA family protein [Helicobacter zhangjianzhongii]|uniref:CvpA family protein n=1 Tax=Helicobacter zhangjianzhongii TaxID=2974574 RepID=A0ACC6FQX2_9HELI|nr:MULTISPECIES: CvpA family protein [unclassified Helicobacter]MDL0079549.1 CvpA family protein [Helicobacter sp. CPD2-1]MDL0081550.1 CvpA family protein [Helicobacter sp. XJK30-2]